MAKIDCYERLRVAFPGLKPEDLQAIRDELDNAQSKLFRPGTLNFSSAEFRQKAMGLLKERRFQELASQVERARNILTSNRNLQFALQDAYKGDPVAAAKTLLAGGEVRNTQGGNLSIGRIARGFSGRWMRQLAFGLEDAGVKDFMAKRVDDRKVAQEMWEATKGGNPGSTGSDMAIKAAKVLNAINDTTLRAKQQAGSMVRKLQGFVTHTIHDPEVLKRVGFDDWFENLVGSEDGHGEGLLDLERSFGVWNREQIQKAMLEDFNRIVRGRNDRMVPDNVSDTFITAHAPSENIARSTARSRTYHFKDGYSWADYNAQFGSKSLMESLISDVHRSGKQVALMKQLGTNPDGGWQGFKIRLKAQLEKTGQEEALQQFTEKEKSLDDLYATVRGTSDGMGTSALARAGQFSRNMEAMAKLGAAWVRGVRDLAPSSFLLKTVNDRNVLSNSVDLLKGYVEQFKDPAEKQRMAQKFSVATEDFMGHMFDQFGAEKEEPGVMAKTMETFFRLSGLPRHFDSLKVAMAKQVGMDLAENAHLDFEGLSPNLKTTLSRYGIDAPLWDGIRKAVDDLPKGQRAITPQRLANLPDAFETPSQHFDAETKLVAMMNDLADSATNTHGDRQKWFLLRGTKDEGAGVILRLISQFKMPMLQELDTFRRVGMSDPATNPTSIAQAAMSQSGAVKMAQFIAMSTVLGYAGNTIVDLAQGKTPQDPTHRDTWTDALVRGGGLGLYGDFLSGEANRSGTRTALKSLAGPVLSDLDTAYNRVASPLLKGEPKGTGRAAMDLAYQNIPFHNLWYLKGAFDSLIGNALKEAVTPGRAERTENSVRSHGQDYWFDPYRPTHSLGVGQ